MTAGGQALLPRQEGWGSEARIRWQSPLPEEGDTLAERKELQDIRSITALTYDQLRHALELIPDDKMAFKAAPLATTPAQIVIHACSADLSYLRVIDGEARSVPVRAEESPTKAQLLELINDTEQSVTGLLDGLDENALGELRKLRWRTEGATVRWIVLHMLRHKHYHVGQLNYIHFLLGIDER